jgi:putative metallohydrolase (TIGR04338 family)
VPDPDRDAVYLAEHRLEALLDRVGTDGGVVTSFGGRFELEPALVFTTLAAAQGFATLTCIERGLPPVLVSHASGERHSTYRAARGGQAPEIRLAGWGGTRLTLCHELAHHAVESDSRAAWGAQSAQVHGAQFRRALTALLEHVGAPEQARWLRLAHRDAGLVTAMELP